MHKSDNNRSNGRCGAGKSHARNLYTLGKTLFACTLVLATTLTINGCGSSDPDAIGGPLSMRRLSPEQYRNAIIDTFGPQVEVAGRFEPDSRRHGLNAVGAALVAVTPSGFEQYEALARSIAAQVVSPEMRSQILPCEPQSANTADKTCAVSIIKEFGPSLLRRPLTDEDVALRAEVADATAQQRADFYAGIELALTSLLVAPDFLFRIETAHTAPTPEQPNRMALDAYSLASKLSYFLWNRGPDDELMAAAGNGELLTPQGLNTQIMRMLAAENLAGGVKAFFEDMLMFDAFEDLSKDITRYPIYSAQVAKDAREQTLRLMVDELVAQKADYRSLFTTRKLPMTRSLGPVYGLPVRAAQGWEEITLPDSHPRAGLLSHASFNMLHAHPGRSSATLRGVFMREALLCQTIPEAPADVDFTQFSQDDSAEHKTARDRLQVHSSQASCKKCHVLTDPIGLGLEVFDGIGRYRTAENGATIDTSGDFDGAAFQTPAELGAAFAANPLVSACLVEKLYRYSAGRKHTNSERRLLRYLEEDFARNGHQVPALMQAIALSEAFRTATAEQSPAASESQENESVAAKPSAEADRSHSS